MNTLYPTDTDASVPDEPQTSPHDTTEGESTAETFQIEQRDDAFIPSEFMQSAEDIEAAKAEKSSNKQGTLYLVSSHIGNPEDLSLRALKALKMADVVVGEEGKTVARLLHENKITKKLEELNEHNEATQTGVLLNLLNQGKNLALVSDAGTPLFADPGAQLVKRCIEKGIRVRAVPGASSIMTALVTSGLPMDSFVFAGFLSREPAERLQELKRLADEPRTVVLLETPYRLVPLLEAARQIMPSRRAYLGCNLTMDSETHHYGTISELYTKFVVMRFKGEFVFCFEGAKGGAKHSAQASGDRREQRSEYRSEQRPPQRFERGEKKFGDKKFGERKFEGRGERSEGGKSFGDKKFGEKKFGDKKFGDRKFGEKKFGDKKFDNRKGGRGDRPFNDRPRTKPENKPSQGNDAPKPNNDNE